MLRLESVDPIDDLWDKQLVRGMTYMKRWLWYPLILFSLMANLASAAEEVAHYGVFGDVWLYYNSPQPANVVLFVSGDGGWNLGVIDMAKTLARLDAAVVGIDITYYLKELEKSDQECCYPAGDLELLSRYIQQKMDYPDYVTPILVGYSSGATLVYAALVQAPSNTFKGGLSLGFCPDLPLTKPMCRGAGLDWTSGLKGKGYSFLPATTLGVPWVALQGDIDQVCDPKETDQFVRQVKNSEIINLQKVGHGFSVQKNWMPQFKQAFLKIAAVQPETLPETNVTELHDLPLTEFLATNNARNVLSVFITGDAGWADADRRMAQSMADSGISVVGINALKYFWHRRTPEEAAQALQRILTYYLPAWKKDRAILMGYSLGADVFPFMISRLPEEMRSKIALVVFVGLGHTVEFKFHLTEWLGKSQDDAMPVKPEVEKLRGMKILCFSGEHDSDALCPELSPDLVTSIVLKGGHHVLSHFGPIIQTMLDAIK
jgi:type IV secretory pathway VirJ component